MPNTKDKEMSGSKDAMSDKADREFQNPGSSQKGTSSTKNTDDMKTAGGKKGNFSDKDRDTESQWSPGSSQSSDQ